MTGPSLLINYFVSRLSNNTLFDDISFVVGYTDNIKNSPLPEPTVAINVKSFSNKRVDPVYDEDGTTLLYNRVAETRMAFNIYVPVKTRGLTAFDIFHRISDYLIYKDNQYSIKTIGCGELKFARDEGALVLKTWADIEENFIE